jgi:predicted metal-binding membrane protein
MSDSTAPAVTRARAAAPTVTLIITLGLAIGCWIVSVGQMNGMDMGVATRLGTFAFFVALWVPMMAAMMLPGAVPAVVRRARGRRGVLIGLAFVGSYLAVWALVGVVVYAVYRPHGTTAAGALVIAAGLYELTPLKRISRQSCRTSRGSGFQYGLCCVGSTAGLMLILLALGLMSITWMAVITAAVLAQKVLPARAAIDVPIALAIVCVGALIIAAPASIPGLTPPM